MNAAYGDITIYVGKTKLPPNVVTKGYSAYIESKTAVLFSDEQVGVIVGIVETRRLPANCVICSTAYWAMWHEDVPSCNAVFGYRTKG